MGLEEAFRAKLVEEQGLQVVDRKGRRRAWFPKNEEVVGDGKRKGNEVQGFTSEFEIMRGDFCEVLVEAVEKVGKTKYVFGGSVEGFEEKEKDVEVRFKDGNIERFDLLVGADGQVCLPITLRFLPYITQLYLSSRARVPANSCSEPKRTKLTNSSTPSVAPMEECTSRTSSSPFPFAQERNASQPSITRPETAV